MKKSIKPFHQSTSTWPSPPATEPFAVANGSRLSTYPKALTNYASNKDGFDVVYSATEPFAVANGSRLSTYPKGFHQLCLRCGIFLGLCQAIILRGRLPRLIPYVLASRNSDAISLTGITTAAFSRT